jgi:WD40 repeat protein
MASIVTNPTTALERAIVRLRDPHGRVVGAGFLVSRQEILTCSHVVDRAVGLDTASGDTSPGGQAEITLDFPFVPTNRDLLARVVAWLPAQDDGAGDIAGLQLMDPAPTDARPVRLVSAREVWGHPFRAFGFPAGYDDGVWASGVLRGRQAAGWVQLEDVRSTGYRVERGFSGTPVWDDELAAVVGMAVAADARPDVRVAYLLPTETLVASWVETLKDQTTSPCPYRGLFAFREQDAAMFFGREELADRLANNLPEHPITAVVGPSGSGKSSLVFAGAIPRLRQAGWTVSNLRPAKGNSPLEAIASTLLPLLDPRLGEIERLSETPKLAALLGDGQAKNVARRVLEQAQPANVLLVVDQFEELYAQDPIMARQFVDVLLEFAEVGHQRGAPKLSQVFTLRADFLGQALEHAGLAERLRDAVLPIGRMTRHQLRRAIEGPIADMVSYEPGLVDRILDEVGEEPGNLPLLEFTLTLLWERQTHRTLTHSGYEDLGGVAGALARYAEQVYLHSLVSQEEREEARRVLVQLVRPGEATEHTRRMAHRMDLGERGWQVSQELALSRLVVMGTDISGAETVEMVHEALISSWDRLREWVETDRAFRAWQERLRAAVEQWDDSNGDVGVLLRGAPLAEAERWLQQRPEDISAREQQFVRASRATQDKSIRRLRATVAALAALVLMIGFLGVRSQQERRRTDEQSRRALSSYLAGQAEARAESQPDLSILLSLEAFKREHTVDARSSLINQQGRWADTTAVLVGHAGTVRAVTFSSDGRLLASGGADGNIVVWDAVQHRRLGPSLSAEGISISALAFNSQNILASASDSDDRVFLWHVARRTQLRPPLTGHKGGVQRLAFSPDGRILSLVNKAGDIVSWNLTTGTRISMPRVGNVQAIAFDSRQRLLAATLHKGEVIIWNTQKHTRIGGFPLGKGDGGLLGGSVTFSQDGRSLAVQSFSALLIWDIVHRRLSKLQGGDGIPFLSPRAELLASIEESNDNTTISLYDTNRSSPIRILDGPPSDSASGNGEQTAALSQLGILATAGVQGVIQLTDTRNLHQLSDRAVSAAYNPVDASLAFGLRDGTIELQHNGKRIRLHPAPGIRRMPISELAISQDGAFIASLADDVREGVRGSEGDFAVSLWDVNRRRYVGRVNRQIKSINNLAFVGDGTMLVGSSWDRSQLYIWNPRSLDAPPKTLQGHEGKVISLTASPDGKALATGDDQGTICLWTITDQNDIHLMTKLHVSDSVSELLLRGHTLISATSSGVATWDITQKTPIAVPLEGAPHDYIDAMALSSNGQTLAVSFSNRGLFLWDVPTRTRLGIMETNSFFGDLVFSPDNTTLIRVGGGGAVARRLDDDSLFHNLCSLVGRNLSDAEWERFLHGQPYRKTCP